MSNSIWLAVGLVLIAEGIGPLIAGERWWQSSATSPIINCAASVVVSSLLGASLRTTSHDSDAQ